MTSERPAAIETPEAPAQGGRSRKVNWLLIIGLAFVGNLVALIFFPPFPKGGEPGEACAYPVCFINGTLEFPNPHVVLDLSPETAPEGRHRRRAGASRSIRGPSPTRSASRGSRSCRSSS